MIADSMKVCRAQCSATITQCQGNTFDSNMVKSWYTQNLASVSYLQRLATDSKGQVHIFDSNSVSPTVTSLSWVSFYKGRPNSL